MTPRALLVSLSITLGLGLAALGLLWFDSPAEGQSDSDAFPIRSAEVNGLSVTTASRGTEHLTRDGAAWLVRWSTAEGEAAWPADESRARAGVRLLLEATTAAGAHDRTDNAQTQVGIETETGVWRLSLGEKIVGDMGLGSLEDPDGEARPVRVTGDVRRMLSDTSLLAWRSLVAMPGLESGASRILLQSKGARLRLARLGPRWAIIEPISARADMQRVERLRGVLASLRFATFEPMPAGSEGDTTGLSDPLATIIVEQDPPGGVGPVVRITMEIGAAAEASGTSMFVRCVVQEVLRGETTMRFGPVLGTIAADELNQVQPNAGYYVVRRATESASPDVRALDVSPQSGSTATFRRSAGAWQSGNGTETTPAEADRLNALVTLLSATECFEVVFAIPTGWQPVAEITLRDASGASLGRHLVATIDPALTGGQAVIGVLTDGLVRVYRAEGLAPLLTWLGRPG